MAIFDYCDPPNLIQLMESKTLKAGLDRRRTETFAMIDILDSHVQTFPVATVALTYSMRIQVCVRPNRETPRYPRTNSFFPASASLSFTR